MHVLILTDGKAGHENQSRALAQGLDCSADIVKTVYPSRVHKGFSYVADRFGLRLDSLFRCDVPVARYDAVICTGSNTFYPGKVTARRLGIPVIANLYPRGYRLDFECILAPEFDTPARRRNVIVLPVNLTPVRPDFYAEQIAAFRSRHSEEGPAVGVIIGGPNAAADLSPAWMRTQLNGIFAASEGKQRWVTTSRRTPPEVEAVVDSFPFDYKLIYSRETFNPIPAFVSLCDTLYVTAESTGMLSEAVSQGTASVEVLMNIRLPKSKFARFVRNLARDGYVRIFGEGSLGIANRKVRVEQVFEQTKRLIGR